MNRIFTTLVAATAGLMISGAAWACPMHGGKIVDINAETNRVVVTKGDDLASFRAIPGKTKITLNGQPAQLADLRAGDVVNVNYDMNEDITEVQVQRAG